MCQTPCAKCFAFIISFMFLTRFCSGYCCCPFHTCGNRFISICHSRASMKVSTSLVSNNICASWPGLLPQPWPKSLTHLPAQPSSLPAKPQVTPFWRFFWHDQQKGKPPFRGEIIRVLEFHRRLPEYEDSSPHHEGNTPKADMSKGGMKVLVGEEEQEEHREQKRVLNTQRG